MKKISLLLVLLFAFNCNKNDDNQTDNESFNVKVLVSDITNKQILHKVNTFVNESALFNIKVEAYLAATTETNLSVVRDQWKQTALTYGAIYAYNIGAIRDQFMDRILYNWPTLPSAIENAINDNSEITQELVAGLSPQIKTLSGLEYLLFGSDLEAANNLFIASEKRRNYLKFVALDFKTQAERLKGIWNTPGNFSLSLIDNEDTGIQSSFNIIYNGLYNLIETAKISKIGKPAGLENSSLINPDQTQAYFSALSLLILKENINSVEKTYFNTEGLGIDDYVFFITKNMALNTAIATKIIDVKNAIDAIPVSLFNAIISHPNQVRTLHEELEALSILFSVDVRSTLSIIITSTDIDGD
ncbi:imelysin family protein [Lacinutrix jangbogonensis]|uniref:imelysin family protein n=1 Tax=Lacinutrix jangbogonensis TaxID=1469557 RepID=UPI00053D4B49|nr:imelysin family protein [Lacinutrix jangbogonensis]